MRVVDKGANVLRLQDPQGGEVQVFKRSQEEVGSIMVHPIGGVLQGDCSGRQRC